jgi:hypothetical protein
MKIRKKERTLAFEEDNKLKILITFGVRKFFFYLTTLSIILIANAYLINTKGVNTHSQVI